MLYLFLLEIVRAIWRDLGSVTRVASARISPNLEVLDPASTKLRSGATIPLRGATTIGREPGNDLVVDEETVSGRHARLVLTEGRWWIEDLGSTNGTVVNGDQVAGSQQLLPGDLIWMGRLQLRFSA